LQEGQVYGASLIIQVDLVDDILPPVLGTPFGPNDFEISSLIGWLEWKLGSVKDIRQIAFYVVFPIHGKVLQTLAAISKLLSIDFDWKDSSR
jgi:hypothetical protein